LFNVHRSFIDSYTIFADAPATVSPAPFAAAAFADPLARVIFLSSTVNVVELIVVVVPSICKLPAITTVPVSSP
jgi:hypothetical protein